jgi:Spy/CpxP family protein refolding chaperone
MKKKVIAVLAAGIITLTAVPLAFAARAERRGQGGFDGHGAVFGMLHRAADELELTTAQKEQLKAIAREVRAENAAYRQTMRGGVKDVASLLIQNPNDVAAAEAVLAKNDEAREQIRSNVLRGVSKALNVLTPSQRAELGQMLQRLGDRAPRF